MASYDDEDGVWRTIGGRRIFIKEGESLSSAMKKSGKFKSTKNKSSQQKYKEESEERVREAKEQLAKSYNDDELKREIEEYKKTGSDPQRQKELERELDTRTQKEKEYSMDGKKISESDIKSEYSKEKSRGNIDKDMSYEDYKKSVVDDRNSNVKSADVRSQQSDIEKASGMKIKKAFETDLYGNGKADRFQLEDGSYIEHTKEALGQKRDDWSLNRVEKGEIKSRDFKSYDDMIDHLNNDRSVKHGIDETKQEINSYLSKVNEYTSKMDSLRDKDDDASKAAYKEAQEKLLHETGYYNSGPEVKSETKSDNSAYKKAFEEYKKKHPNTKLNLQKFIDMSEGK